MGFLRRLFSGKKPANPRADKDRRRWSFSRSSNTPNKIQSAGCADGTLDANKHAIAVAAATAAVAEAALAAAHAAAEVVRLTSAGPAGFSHRHLARESAAVKIQSAFRAYLARRALRALKALVKLQALVRGYIVRKQTADMLRRMQTLVRLQARARATRAHVTESLSSSSKFSTSRYAVPASPDKDEYQLRAYSSKFDGPSILKRCGSNSNMRDFTDLDKPRMGSNWLDRWMEDSIWKNNRDASSRHGHIDDDKSDKILEVDTWKPRLNSQPSSRTFRTTHHGFPSGYINFSSMTSESPQKMTPKASYPGEALPINSSKVPGGRDEVTAMTADTSPKDHSTSSRLGSSSSRRSPFTTTRSECSWGYFNGYSGHPNYMAYTESSRAKFRSQSAPRQRFEFDRYGSANRSFQDLWNAGSNEREFRQNPDFRYKAYPASDRFSRPGTPKQ